jgi:branched-subunit amino acid ABC-type transport system permease component
MSLGLTVEFIIADAAVNAVIIASLSLGYTMILRTEGFPHLWLVNFMPVGAYASLIVSELWRGSPYLGVPAGFLLGGALGLACHLLIYRRLRAANTGPVYMTLASLGLGVLASAGLGMVAFWLMEQRGIYALGFSLRERDFGFQGVSGAVWVMALLGIVVAVSTLIALRTMPGIAWRAFTEDTGLLQVCGFNPDRVRAASWFFAHGLAASLGSLYAVYYQGNPSMGRGYMSAMALASILGGETLTGSLLAGLGLGAFNSAVFGAIPEAGVDFVYSLKYAVQPILIWVALWFKERIDGLFKGWA